MDAAVAALEPVLAYVRSNPALAPLLATAGLADAAPRVLAGALLAFVLATLLVGRAIVARITRPKSLPPVVACFPFVGGFIRFLKVRARVHANIRKAIRRSAPRSAHMCAGPAAAHG